MAIAWVLATGCTGLFGPVVGIPHLIGDQSLSIGQWSGTTSQGMPISFTVSQNETVIAITVGYDFNGCTGTQTFEDLSVPTAPNVTCIPGPCSGVVTSYRAFGYSSDSSTGGPRTQINGLFLPGGRAEGQIGFFDYPACGTATAVRWTATRQ